MSKPKPTQEQLLILGDTLRRAREANGFTLEKLAELIDCSSRWLQKLETGKSNPHWPVSYTHLDVYKRQPHSCRCR